MSVIKYLTSQSTLPQIIWSWSLIHYFYFFLPLFSFQFLVVLYLALPKLSSSGVDQKVLTIQVYNCISLQKKHVKKVDQIMLIKAQRFFCFVLFLPGLYYSFIIILSLVLNTDIFNTSVKPVSLQLLRIYFWDKYSPAKMTHSSNVNYHFLNESYVNFFTFKIF